MTISEFKGPYYFLSNFYPAKVTYNGVTYRNAEAAFQAGLDGDICDIQSVNLSGKTEDDTIILEDGSEVTVAEIVAVMDEFE